MHMDMDRPHPMDGNRSVGFLLHDVARLMRYRFDARARDLGVTRQQWRALITIAIREGQTQAELADRLEVERITLCRMVDRLAEAGLVERRADPKDRRVWRLHLLPAAHDIVERLTHVGAEMEAQAHELIGEHFDAVVEGLARLREGLRDDGPRRKVA
jgi:DNA-binding MarR family transcriptional regulator